jgi:signal transduction histidine kinase
MQGQSRNPCDIVHEDPACGVHGLSQIEYNVRFLLKKPFLRHVLLAYRRLQRRVMRLLPQPVRWRAPDVLLSQSGVTALMAAVLMVIVAVNSAAAETKRVLILHSFGRDFLPFSEFLGLFREQLVKASPNPIDLYEASLETVRYSDPQDDTPLLEYLRSLFSNRKLDLVVTVGGPAARFIQRYRSEPFFLSTPMLVTAVDERIVDIAALHASDAVIAFKIDLAAVINNILQVLPRTTDVAVIFGNSPFEKYWVEEARQELQSFMDRIKFTWLNEFSLDEILQRVASLPPRSAIFYGLFAVDAAGVPHAGDRPLQELHAHANAPIFTFIDTYMGRGIVGGPLLSHASLSRLAVEAAVRILGGETSDSVRMTTLGIETPVYDWRELQRWNIDESRLPTGSIVQFREPGLWERYRWLLIAVAVALLIQAAIIAWLLAERHRRVRAELESRGRLLETIHLNRTAAAGALSASIAHELNQPLGAIQNYADAAEQYLKADPPNLDRALTILGNIRRDDQRAAEIIMPLRGLLKKRSEIELQEFDLNRAVGDAIHILESEALKRGVSLIAAQAKVALPVRADQIHLQQVILNLALNGLDAMQDCDPSNAKLTIRSALTGKALAEVSVIDSGVGVPNNLLSTVFETFFTTKQHGTGLGLSIARTIIEAYGGKIWAENCTEGGAVFRFTLPLAKSVAT